MSTMQTPVTNDPSNLLAQMPKGLPFRPKDTNYRLLDSAWRVAGLKPSYPVNTRNMILLARIAGYAVRAHHLDYHLAKGYIKPPKKTRRGDYIWDRDAIVRALDSFESARLWFPGPIHEHKFSPEETVKFSLLAAGVTNAAQALERKSLNELLDLLTNCSNPTRREILVGIIKRKTGVADLKGTETAGPVNAEAN